MLCCKCSSSKCSSEAVAAAAASTRAGSDDLYLVMPKIADEFFREMDPAYCWLVVLPIKSMTIKGTVSWIYDDICCTVYNSSSNAALREIVIVSYRLYLKLLIAFL